MNTNVQFINLNGFNHMRLFVEASVDRSLGKFDAADKLDTNVSLGVARARTETQSPLFECEVLITGNGRWFRPIVVKKENTDFYKAFKECLNSAEKGLRRQSKLRSSSRRHGTSVRPTHSEGVSSVAVA